MSGLQHVGETASFLVQVMLWIATVIAAVIFSVVVYAQFIRPLLIAFGVIDIK